jgi:hypothetical protein
VRIKGGQVIRFRDTAARILLETRFAWRPGGVASAMQAARTLRVREHAEELASLVEMTKKASDSVGSMTKPQEELKWQTKTTKQRTA